MKSNFEHTANLIRTAREAKGLTQLSLSQNLGLKSPQFISNIERGTCGISKGYVGGLSEILGISADLIIDALTADYRARLKKHVIFKALGVQSE